MTRPANKETQTMANVYIRTEKKNDKALNMAYELLRGTKTNPAFPPSAKAAQAPN